MGAEALFMAFSSYMDFAQRERMNYPSRIDWEESIVFDLLEA